MMENKTIESVAAMPSTDWQRHRAMIGVRCTLPFLTMLFIFMMTAAVFAVVMANAVYLAREETNHATQQDLAIMALTFGSALIFGVHLNFFFGRYDLENRLQRHWILATAILLGIGVVVHNVFWYLGVAYHQETFPSPNSASFTIVGFVMCFLLAIAGWYQLKFTHRLYV